MKLFVCVWFLVPLLTSGRTDSLSCYQCSGIDSLDNCPSVTKCVTGQSCFTRSETVGENLTFTMGCTADENCGKIPLIDTISASNPIEQCYECCGRNECNKKLCKPQKRQPLCEDTVDCPWLNEMFNICEDINDAKLICRNFCKLCSLVDGNWALWSSWSECDVTCGLGKHTRVRTCTNPAPAYRGEDCKGNGTDTKPCVRQPCPVHGGWSEWSDWQACSVTCGTGIQKRFRNCTAPYPSRYGDHCFGESMDVNMCIQELCAAVDGGWTNWGNWSRCSESCNGGLRKRLRSCSNPRPERNGRNCDGEPTQVELCNRNACGGIATPTVAFKARLSRGLSVTINQIIAFPIVQLNAGDAYSSETGRFTAPVNGTYMFTTSFCVTNQKTLVAGLMVDGTKYTALLLYGNPSHECKSADSVAVLEAGQRVWIQILYGGSSGSIILQDSYRWNTFSGALLNGF